MRYEPIYKEALPSVTASTQIFANAPTNTEMILLQIRGSGITMQFDGDVATANTNGIDYGEGERVELRLNYTSAREIRAIENGGTATGYIVYFTK